MFMLLSDGHTGKVSDIELSFKWAALIDESDCICQMCMRGNITYEHDLSRCA